MSAGPGFSTHSANTRGAHQRSGAVLGFRGARQGGLYFGGQACDQQVSSGKVGLHGWGSRLPTAGASGQGLPG